MISQEEAIERADQDHGDDDDVVWMKQNSRGRIYHDDPNCSYLSADSVVEFTRLPLPTKHAVYGALSALTVYLLVLVVTYLLAPALLTTLVIGSIALVVSLALGTGVTIYTRRNTSQV